MPCRDVPSVQQLVLIKELLCLLQHTLAVVSCNNTREAVAGNKPPCEQARATTQVQQNLHTQSVLSQRIFASKPRTATTLLGMLPCLTWEQASTKYS